MLRNLFRREPTPQEREQIESAVQKTRQGALGHISDLFRQQVITEETWDELEDLLIQADVGPTTAIELVSRARKEVEKEELKTPVEAETAVRRQMVEILGRDEHEPLEEMPAGTIILMVGVNGSGKTTSIAKLASYLEQRGRSVLLAAADTFRAAAIDQLRVWGERVKAPVVAHQQEADPGAVVFDAVKAAQSRGLDLVLVDTAGRLHTKFNLMEELQKIKRVASKANPEAHIVSLLTLDATTGQNAILQAKSFLQSVEVDGIILSKLDGTAKGGVAFSVYNELGVPIWYIGTGEKVQDLAPFDHLAFVNALFE
ncbi:MAG TPA: signal recognition particle-docking protein FtsY [Chloroflexota bacterium]|nr:signal recognition particle-docking protein FtsY [Chloroflexota bacterium]